MNFSAASSAPSLDALRIIEVTGDDASAFLQGQLTQDVSIWPDLLQVRRAAWCTVKGRMWATFYVWKIESGFRLLIAEDLLEKTIKRLRLYVLRAKVSVTALDCEVFVGAVELPVMTVHKSGNSLGLLNTQGLVLGVSVVGPLPMIVDWNTAHIQAAAAWVAAASSEQFVPQAANFELVGGVNFRKGCYPGQEVVARSQYLGKLRRRAVVAQLTGNMPAVLSDIRVQGEANPIGSVILAAPGWVLFECPQDVLANGAVLTVHGAVLSVRPLPYEIVDITQ